MLRGKGRGASQLTGVDETVDRIFGGRVSVIQSRRGYRFSLDTLLLIAFVPVQGAKRIVDLGCGCGVVPLSLATFDPRVECVGVELQAPLLARARKALELNGLEDRVTFIRANVRELSNTLESGAFDIVTCNPPYRRLRSGRPNPDAERYVARHEIEATLADFVDAGTRLLRHRGRMCLVYPAGRAVDLWSTMSRSRIEPHRARFVQSFADTDATLVLVEGIKDGRADLRVLPPLVIYESEDVYTKEMQAVLDGSVFR